MELFSTEYFAWIRQGSQRLAREIVPLILEMKKPQRVIDIACGTGEWLSVFREHGATTVRGIDGTWIDPQMLSIREDEFTAQDVAQPFAVDGEFDLALMLEAIQHVPRETAGAMVATLTSLAPVVIVSAPIPHQGGSGKAVSEQWPDYWADLFAAQGYICVDALRRALWNNPRVEWWYAQNMLMFASAQEVASNPALRATLDANPGPPLRLIHPRFYLDKMMEIPTSARLTDRIANALQRTAKMLAAPIGRRSVGPPLSNGNGARAMAISETLLRRN